MIVWVVVRMHPLAKAFLTLWFFWLLIPISGASWPLLHSSAYRGIDMKVEDELRPRLKYPDAPRLLARNVWRYREQRRMTANALAEKLDWPLSEIDKIENGDKFDLSLDELERLSLALHVEPSDLLRRNSGH